MRKPWFWMADRLVFTVTGRGAALFLSRAAARGVRLWQIRCISDGYRASAAGRDLAVLQALALKGGWILTVTARRGPGRLALRLRARPGIPVGLLAFFVLLGLLPGYLWSIDFGALDAAQQQTMRSLLADARLYEGAPVSEPALRAAQQALTLESGQFGWISLNFIGGCLHLESRAAQPQSVRPTPQDTALYAAADGLVTAVNIESGFARVKPGQAVVKGQLLAAAAKRDRSGAPVVQAAAGTVAGQVEAAYTAEIPLQATAAALTGRCRAMVRYCVLGFEFPAQAQAAAPYPDADRRESWQPIMLGRLALPAGVCRREFWERADRRVTRSTEAAKRLAARECRRLLRADFPDAALQTMRLSYTAAAGGWRCRAVYRFTANIARSEPNHTELPPAAPDAG